MLSSPDVRGLPARSDHLTSGRWLPGELLGTWRSDWPAVLEPTSLVGCSCQAPRCRSAVLECASVVVVHEIDWAARSGRLEIGVAREADPARTLALALHHAFSTLLLDRAWGWVSDPAATGSVLAEAGMRREAVVPRAVWHRDRLVDRELWTGRRDG